MAAAGGSGVGISDIDANSVDIGASDAPMTSSQYSGDSHGPIEIPWALTATGVGYNLPGVGTGLKLSSTVLAEIYTGKITTWSSSAITKLNPNFAKALKKDGKITPVFRSDGSGDSYAFQSFLIRGAPKAWTIAPSTTFPGTVGQGENGNAGVAGEVRSNKGTIGYISAAYLIQQNIHVASIENAAGAFELPDAKNIANAASSNTSIPAQGSAFTSAGGVVIQYPAKKFKTAYPISTYSYAILNQSGSLDSVATNQGFLNWVISPTGGQKLGGNLDFVPLPAAIRNADSNLISSL